MVAEKNHLIEAISTGSSVEKFYQHKKSFTRPSFSYKSYATNSAEKKETIHPRLHFQLRELRNNICEQKNVPIYMVANGKTIDEMVLFLPQTPEELTKISGFGKAKVEQYGEKFLEIIVDYCKENGLSSLVHEKVSKRERKSTERSEKKPDTKAITYQLYKQGKTVSEIVEERKLTTQTIEGHLAFQVNKSQNP